MPSHRADTPADAPTILAPRPSAHPQQQRRRDLRAHGHGPAGTTGTPARSHAPASALAWLEAAEESRSVRPPAPRAASTPSRREVHGRARSGGSTAVLDRDAETTSLSSFGAPAPESWFEAQQEAARPVALLPEPRAPRTPPRGVEVAPATLPAAPAPAPAVERIVERTAPPVAEPAVEPVAQPGTAEPSPFDFSADAAAAATSGPARRVAGPAGRAGKAGRRNGVSLPQAGIAGALGLATIAIPLTGAFAVSPTKQANPASAAALAPLPPFPLVTAPARTALDDVRLLPDEQPAASVPAKLAAPRTLLVGRVSRSNERAVLPGCDGHVPDTSGVRNGELPASMLCTLWDPHRQLRSDAAVGMAKLNLAYQGHFGHPMCFSDAYRSLSQQYQVKAERGSFAARPGTSEHGWGLAVDLCDGVEQGPSSLTYQWMRTNAPLYGWQNPTWALSGGAGPYEPWHWEYVPGEKGQSSAD